MSRLYLYLLLAAVLAGAAFSATYVFVNQPPAQSSEARKATDKFFDTNPDAYPTHGGQKMKPDWN